MLILRQGPYNSFFSLIFHYFTFNAILICYPILISLKTGKEIFEYLFDNLNFAARGFFPKNVKIYQLKNEFNKCSKDEEL